MGLVERFSDGLTTGGAAFGLAGGGEWECVRDIGGGMGKGMCCLLACAEVVANVWEGSVGRGGGGKERGEGRTEEGKGKGLRGKRKWYEEGVWGKGMSLYLPARVIFLSSLPFCSSATAQCSRPRSAPTPPPPFSSSRQTPHPSNPTTGPPLTITHLTASVSLSTLSDLLVINTR